LRYQHDVVRSEGGRSVAKRGHRAGERSFGAEPTTAMPVLDLDRAQLDSARRWIALADLHAVRGWRHQWNRGGDTTYDSEGNRHTIPRDLHRGRRSRSRAPMVKGGRKGIQRLPRDELACAHTGDRHHGQSAVRRPGRRSSCSCCGEGITLAHDPSAPRWTALVVMNLDRAILQTGHPGADCESAVNVSSDLTRASHRAAWRTCGGSRTASQECTRYNVRRRDAPPHFAPVE
jgi:hypothetical protein